MADFTEYVFSVDLLNYFRVLRAPFQQSLYPFRKNVDFVGKFRRMDKDIA
jgi:hypothetical protein